MLLEEKVRKSKKSGQRFQPRVRGAWIALIVFCSMVVLGAILLASMDNYDFLFKP
jgi:hypothetical protein